MPSELPNGIVYSPPGYLSSDIVALLRLVQSKKLPISPCPKLTFDLDDYEQALSAASREYPKNSIDCVTFAPNLTTLSENASPIVISSDSERS